MREALVVTQGHQLFADALTQLAAEISDPRLSAIAADITAPLRVAVSGRRGVGRRTVAAALAAAGVRIAGRSGSDADMTVHVIAEVVKPEDVEDVAARQDTGDRSVLVVLNKADLAGHCGAAGAAAAMRVPVEPMSALFALAAVGDRPGAGLDRGLWEVCRQLAEQPADLSSTEQFVSCPHPVSRQVRERLCAVLDLSGIERMLELARQGGTAGRARTMLRRLSGIDGVVERLAAMGAGPHHRRMSQAVVRLEAMAVGDSRIDEFLVADAAVAARMTAAAAVVQEQWVPDEPALRRARRWQAYRGAPVGAAQRACAVDIARGSLRAWSVTRGLP